MTKHEVDCTVKQRTRHSEATLVALTLLITGWWEEQEKVILHVKDIVKYFKITFSQNTTNLLSIINVATCFDS